MVESKSASGGTTRLLTDVVAERPEVNLELLEPYRMRPDIALRPAGTAPFFAPGTPIRWQYGRGMEMMRVIVDDERGLICWQANGSERTKSERLDGVGFRDVPAEERFSAATRQVQDSWRGPGLVRVAPTGAGYSIWFFRNDEGFWGSYINLELPHLRPLDGSAVTYTRDLILDLWVENDEVWLKDFDEVEAAVGPRITREQAEEIYMLADQIRFDLIQTKAWPIDSGWETWTPPAEWAEPVPLDIPIPR